MAKGANGIFNVSGQWAFHVIHEHLINMPIAWTLCHLNHALASHTYIAGQQISQAFYYLRVGR